MLAGKTKRKKKVKTWNPDVVAQIYNRSIVLEVTKLRYSSDTLYWDTVVIVHSENK
jgi:hypothetical protein